jgi:uncharacterized protein YecA (UPF0149 family)
MMGDIVTLPLRGQAGDLDTLGKVAALSVMPVELARLAELGEDGEIEIMLNGETRQLDRQAMLAIAHDMLSQRQAILNAVGERSAAELVKTIAKAVATMTEAETMLADQTERASARSVREPETRWRRPCTTGRRAGKLPTTDRDPAPT